MTPVPHEHGVYFTEAYHKFHARAIHGHLW